MCDGSGRRYVLRSTPRLVQVGQHHEVSERLQVDLVGRRLVQDRHRYAATMNQHQQLQQQQL